MKKPRLEHLKPIQVLFEGSSGLSTVEEDRQYQCEVKTDLGSSGVVMISNFLLNKACFSYCKQIILLFIPVYSSKSFTSNFEN